MTLKQKRVLKMERIIWNRRLWVIYQYTQYLKHDLRYNR